MTDDLVKRYRDLQGAIGGCHDGYCVIKKPQGMHTNGGCNCLEDMKLHERHRIGGLLRHAQQMADRIEELEAKLRSSALQELSALGQASEAYQAQLAAEAKLAKAVEAGVDVAASLNAAISLLERGGKKAAASDRMFAQMLLDYNASLDRFRATLAELKGQGDE